MIVDGVLVQHTEHAYTIFSLHNNPAIGQGQIPGCDVVFWSIDRKRKKSCAEFTRPRHYIRGEMPSVCRGGHEQCPPVEKN